ncbi:protein of unknown function [Thauera humireducens]|nr:protein of unknown function [Thauera humireducens]
MHLADLPGATQALQVEQARAQSLHHQRRGSHLLVEAGEQHAGDEFVDLIAIPPALHVAFAQAEAAARQDAFRGLRVVDAHVPRALAVDLDVGLGKQAGHGAQRRVLLPWPEGAARATLVRRAWLAGVRFAGLVHALHPVLPAVSGFEVWKRKEGAFASQLRPDVKQESGRSVRAARGSDGQGELGAHRAQQIEQGVDVPGIRIHVRGPPCNAG